MQTLKRKQPKICTTSLNDRNEEFQLKLKNSFENLEEFRVDLNAWYNEIAEITKRTAKDIGDLPTKNNTPLPAEIKDLMNKRRKMKRDLNLRSKIMYTEICKTIRKKIREHNRTNNMKMIETAIENNRSIKIILQNAKPGKSTLSKLNSKDGKVLNNQNQILDRIKEFYEELYTSNLQIEQTENKNSEEVHPVTTTEVEFAVKKMKKNKAAGLDELDIDVIKEAGKPLYEELANLYSNCLKKGKVPDSWKQSELILIHKKGNNGDLKNYRPISLLSHAYKIFTRIIANRLEKLMDESQSLEQAGFRKGFGTMDHIHTINQLKEKCQEYKLPLCLSFIDYEKAFDSVEINSIINSLTAIGTPTTYTNLLNDIYTNCKSIIKLNSSSNEITINKGVRQGDTISPKLFTTCLELVFRKLNWTENRNGININGKSLNHLKFADDIVIITHELKENEQMMNELQEASKSVGLKINLSKTKILINNHVPDTTVKLNNINIEILENFTYLGQTISLKDKTQTQEIRKRIRLGWAAFGKLSYILKSNLPQCLKTKVFNQCILPIMTYGAETWNLSKEMERKIRAAQHNMERSMLNITWKDRLRNEEIRKRTKVKDITRRAKQLKWNWAGHIMRRDDNRWTKVTTEWEPYVKRRCGRPKKRWRDELVQHHRSNTWSRKARDRKKWIASAEAFLLQWSDKG
ncbi:reverse transcriptase family protein [archaeon]|nr:reverse transcriptase family protein [archaeon]